MDRPKLGGKTHAPEMPRSDSKAILGAGRDKADNTDAMLPTKLGSRWRLIF
jgi:hypothetical protein